MKTIDTAQVLVKHLPPSLLSEVVKPYIYQAYQALEEGHLCIDIEGDGLQALDNPLFQISHFKEGTKFYLKKFWALEDIIFSKLLQFISEGKSRLSARKIFLETHRQFICAELFQSYEEEGSGTSVDWQKVATINAYLHNFAIITGGPGTGKTTTVAKLICLLFLEAGEKALQVELVAQTGKAAARLKESLMASTTDSRYGIGHIDDSISERFSGIEPKTIHRLLGFVPNSTEFEHNENNPLTADVIVVDEASMADAPLLAKLMQAVKPGARFYLLGDRNQLSSVEVGSVFSDLCLAKLDVVNDLSSVVDGEYYLSFLSANEAMGFKSFQETSGSEDFVNQVIELKRSYRFDDKQQIGLLAKELINNKALTAEHLELYKDGKGQEVCFVDQHSSSNFFFKSFESYINEKDVAKALRHLNKAKILCALKRDAVEYNLLVEQNLQKKKLLVASSGFYNNQPIMVTSNDYFSGLYNGDMGLIRMNEKGDLRAFFEFSTPDGQNKEIRDFSPAAILSFETAFAITIHKSQGSEFDTVLMVLPESDEKNILSKELVYTGLTRAKKRAYIHCSPEVFLAAANEPTRRISGLANRIQQRRRAI